VALPGPPRYMTTEAMSYMTGPRWAPVQSISPVMSLASSWRNASGAGSVCNVDHVTFSESASARTAEIAAASHG